MSTLCAAKSAELCITCTLAVTEPCVTPSSSSQDKNNRDNKANIIV